MPQLASYRESRARRESRRPVAPAPSPRGARCQRRRSAVAGRRPAPWRDARAWATLPRTVRTATTAVRQVGALRRAVPKAAVRARAFVVQRLRTAAPQCPSPPLQRVRSGAHDATPRSQCAVAPPPARSRRGPCRGTPAAPAAPHSPGPSARARA